MERVRGGLSRVAAAGTANEKKAAFEAGRPKKKTMNFTETV